MLSACKICSWSHEVLGHAIIPQILNGAKFKYKLWRNVMYSASKKNPRWGLVAISPKWLGIFQPNFTCLLCVPIYARLQIFIQLTATLTKLCHIKHDHQVHNRAQNLHHWQKHMLAFFDTFPKKLGIFSPNFTRLLNVHIYNRMQIFIQLSPTVTKFCHIKCDHPQCVSVDGGRFEHIMVVPLNMA